MNFKVEDEGSFEKIMLEKFKINSSDNIEKDAKVNKLNIVVNFEKVYKGNSNRYIYFKESDNNYKLLSYDGEYIFKELFTIQDILPQEILEKIVGSDKKTEETLSLTSRKLNNIFVLEKANASDIAKLNGVKVKTLIYDKVIPIPEFVQNIIIEDFNFETNVSFEQLNLKSLDVKSNQVGIPLNLETFICSVQSEIYFRYLLKRTQNVKNLSLDIFEEVIYSVNFNNFNNLQKLIFTNEKYTTLFFNENLKELDIGYYHNLTKFPISLEKLIIKDIDKQAYENEHFSGFITNTEVIKNKPQERGFYRKLDLSYLANLKQLQIKDNYFSIIFPSSLEILYLSSPEDVSYLDNLKELYFIDNENSYERFNDQVIFPKNLQKTNYPDDNLPQAITHIYNVYNCDELEGIDLSYLTNLKIFSNRGSDSNEDISRTLNISEDLFFGVWFEENLEIKF